MAANQGDFNRFRRTLLLDGEADRVPLYDTVDRGIMSAWLGKPEADLAGSVEFYSKAGYDFVRTSVDLWSMLTKGKKGAPAGHTRSANYSLYAGATTERHWAQEGKGIISSMEEFDRFQWPGLEDMDFSPYERIGELTPPGMKTLGNVGHIFTAVWTLMGFETFCMALIQEPALVAQMFEKIGSVQYEVLDRVTRFKSVGAIHVSDDIAYTSGLIISPKHLRQYLFPWFKRMCSLCRERDIVIIYHTDGKVDDVLDDIVAAGFHGLHPIQPNAMDIKKVKERVGDKICLLGNIDMDTLARGTPEQVEELVKRNLKEIAPGGGYCVGSSNSVSDFVKMENYNAMRETVFKYGTYPIRA
ncbi:MAG: uroporphyrinogen decarboxylase family protein [Chloroflexota bacterium]